MRGVREGRGMGEGKGRREIKNRSAQHEIGNGGSKARGWEKTRG